MATIARLEGRKISVEEIKAELDRIAGLVDERLGGQGQTWKEATRLKPSIGEEKLEVNEWKLNPWEERVIRIDRKGGEGGKKPNEKEEGWLLDPFQVKLPSAGVSDAKADERKAAGPSAQVGENPKKLKVNQMLDGLNRVLYEELGFYGVPQVWLGEPETVFIDSVLKSKGGNPLTLGVIYMNVARRVGLRLHAVDLSSRFLLYSPDADIYIDPHNGNIMPPADAARFSSVFSRRLLFPSGYQALEVPNVEENSSPNSPSAPKLHDLSSSPAIASRIGTFGICQAMVLNLYMASVNTFGSDSEEAQRWMRQQAILREW